MRAILRREGFEANALQALASTGVLSDRACRTLHEELSGDGVEMDGADAHVFKAIEQLARAGLVALQDAGETATIIPVAEAFQLSAKRSLDEVESWKLSKFQYMQIEDGMPTVRSPLGDALVRVHAPAALTLLSRFAAPTTLTNVLAHNDLGNSGRGFIDILVRADIILPCDADGLTADDTDDDRRMWDFHELLYHSRSRLGRSGFRIGATWEFKGDIPQPPCLSKKYWGDGETIPLYRPAALSRDLSLFDAMETRQSIRSYSPAPITAWELGEFLFRTMRVRSHIKNGDFEIASRPYPNGGGIYEQELYVTVEACADLPRGFYYYDPVAHALCPVSPPGKDMQMLIEEAVSATAGQGRPQVLFTIASRFG
ncbi:hypothetical protein, partial [Roseovarius sp.]|uniref:hypothetical protein n=1 Tax=Roseovarius sp. TaxID=1486281 RepID=UPI003569A33C